MKLLGTAWSSFSNDACRVMSALLLEMLDKLWNSATVLDKLSLINAGNHSVKSKIQMQTYRYMIDLLSNISILASINYFY